MLRRLFVRRAVPKQLGTRTAAVGLPARRSIASCAVVAVKPRAPASALVMTPGPAVTVGTMSNTRRVVSGGSRVVSGGGGAGGGGYEVLLSQIDPSLNLIRPFGDRGGELESRAVFRGPTQNKLCVYISSHAGCNQGCRQCHLTQNGQTSMKPSTVDDYVQQFRDVLDEVARLRSYSTDNLERCTAEFMARGEALQNPSVQRDWPAIFYGLQGALRAREHSGALPRRLAFKAHISTILPRTWTSRSLSSVFMQDPNPESWPVFYYSAWFLNPDVQRMWMPQAMPMRLALAKLADYQRAILEKTGDPALARSKVLLHRAFIAGKNDTVDEVRDLLAVMKDVGLMARINSLRFTQPPKVDDVETPEPRRSELLRYLRDHNPGGFKEIERAGEDVKASCGVFVAPTSSRMP